LKSHLGMVIDQWANHTCHVWRFWVWDSSPHTHWNKSHAFLKFWNHPMWKHLKS